MCKKSIDIDTEVADTSSMPTATIPRRAKKSDQFTTIRLRVDSRKALGQICRTHGVKSWRAMELLVDGWNELTDEQRGRIFAK